MTSRPSDDLRAAAEEALAKVHEFPQPFEQKAMAALERLTSLFISEFDAVKAELAEARKALKESEEREIHLHECIEKLVGVIYEADKRIEESARTRHAAITDRLADVMAKLDSIGGECRLLGHAANVSRSEALRAAELAAASERYVKDATSAARAERPSEPAIPSRRHPTTLPQACPYESGAPGSPGEGT